MGQADCALYRRCVGLAVFNSEGKVFLGRRRMGLETGRVAQAWQMPQGGIDAGETPIEAAFRELYEETNIRSVTLLGEAAEWRCYDLPLPAAGKLWRGRYKGQTQKWFAFRFEGRDDEIDVRHPAGGRHRPEFIEWRWEDLRRAAQLIVPFKRAVYEQVAVEFAPWAEPSGIPARDGGGAGAP